MATRPSARALLLLVLVALGALGELAACSGDDDGTATTTTSPPPPPTTAPPTTEQPGEQMFVFDIGPGECFDQRVVVEEDGSEVPADFRVSCDGPHQNEVFVSVDHPAAPGEPYPDEQSWNRFLSEQCYQLVEQYVGTPYELSELEVSHRKPSPESWAAEPDRRVTCWLHLPDGTKVTGSLMGSNR